MGSKSLHTQMTRVSWFKKFNSFFNWKVSRRARFSISGSCSHGKHRIDSPSEYLGSDHRNERHAYIKDDIDDNQKLLGTKETRTGAEGRG